MFDDEIDKLYTEEQQQAIKNEGYRAQANGENMVLNNPYQSSNAKHWLWRKGFIEAFKDSNITI